MKDLPVRISDATKKWSEKSPEQPALVESGGTWTYGQLASIVCGTKRWLAAEGVRPGDRVILLGDNCCAFVALLLAVADLDAWPVPVNSNISARELGQLREHCGARRVIYVCASAQATARAKLHGGTIKEIDGLGSIAVGPLDEQSQPEALELNPEDRVGALLYTSGTTGLPKGVMLSHKALLFVAAESAKIRSLTCRDRLYGVMPMFHVVGLSVVLLGGLLSGATIYLARQFDPVVALRSFDKDELTVVLGAPAMFSLLLEYAKMKGMKSLKFPGLRILASAGAPLHSALKSAVENLFGLVLHNGYGLTECSPTIAQTRIEFPRTDTSVGPVFPEVEVKVVGPDREAVADGEVGELLVRGPNLMKGYYRAPEETHAAIDAQGWFNTRDLARIEGGNLFLMGRTKDLIIHFGHNVYPAEVESVLNSHPAVMRSAVIGRASADASGGEEIVAIVQPLSGSSVTSAELTDYASHRLATYKRPSHVLLVSKMPETSTGKIIRDELKKLADSIGAPHELEPAEAVTS
jgi:acyl-CoA synthetase (AMP-forming)/AMP-acid ligase II